MQIKILKFDDHINETGLVISLGFFDGMHIAHRTLLDKTLEIAKTQNLKSGIMTFSTHVLSFIKNQPFHHLTNLDEKAKKAQAMGFDYLYIFEVTKDLISLDYLTFIQRFLSCATIVVVGFDFTFGYRGLGNATTLQNSPNFKTIVLDEMVYETEKIGSTRIREALSNRRHYFSESSVRLSILNLWHCDFW